MSEPRAITGVAELGYRAARPNRGSQNRIVLARGEQHYRWRSPSRYRCIWLV
jgi:hypothetical protein